MVCEVVGRVGKSIDQKHPTKLVGGEELERGAKEPLQPTSHSILNALLTVRIFNDGTVQNGVGR